MIRVGDIARIIEEEYPLRFALEGDNCGLQLGDVSLPLRGVLVALDPSREAVGKAAGLSANVVVTHHPLFYDPIRRLDAATAVGSAAAAAHLAGISLIAAHTNLDGAPGGLAGEIAARAGLTDIRTFAAHSAPEKYKLTVFVPEAHLSKVYRALSRAGAGVIGAYGGCAFAGRGEGMFRPLTGARPAVGKKGRLEKTKEVRLEMVVDADLRQPVVKAMRAAHPYEEAAFDLYPLAAEEEGGLGRIGAVAGVSLKKYLGALARAFGAAVRISGRAPARISKVACVPGSGGGYVAMAHRLGAELLVTGEVRYHQALEAEHLGIGIAELGHDRSEMPAVDLLAATIRRGLKQMNGKIKVHTYRRREAVRVGACQQANRGK